MVLHFCVCVYVLGEEEEALQSLKRRAICWVNLDRS
jgi:hypothetical protein